MKITQLLKHTLCRGVIAGLASLSGVAMATGLLIPVDSNSPALEILSHEVDVTIQDGYSITNIEQVFHNPSNQDTEARYEFPVPDKASVSEFTIWIDNQPVTGEVLEKKKAKQIHQEEKAAGRSTGLAQQESFKRFEILVSPVRAGQDTRIRLQYMQPTDIQTGIGRYVYALEEGGVDEEKLSFWGVNNAVTEYFRFTLNLVSANPIEAMRAPNIADAVVTQVSDSTWRLQIERVGMGINHSAGANKDSTADDAETAYGEANNQAAVLASEVENKNLDQVSAKQMQEAYEYSASSSGAAKPVMNLDSDIAVYWRLAQYLPASLELVSHRVEGDSKGTFMMVMTPGDDLKPIENGRDWMFVLDISGSMNGKYATLTQGVEKALKKFSANDRFRIMAFNNSVQEITTGWMTASEENVNLYSKKLANIKPNGSTDLHSGITKGLRALEKDRTSGIILVTDGVANVGETQKRQFVKLLNRYDTRVFTFVMGNEANRPLLKSISNVSNGFALNVSNSDDIVGKIMEATQRINHQAMHGITLKLDGVRTSGVTPGEIHSVYRGEQIIVFGHYWSGGDLDVTLSAKISGETRRYQQTITLPDVAADNPEIERLWAFSKIAELRNQVELFGEDADIKTALVDLGVEHGIVTENTSMIVMQESQFAARGLKRINKQRLATEKKAQNKRANQKGVNQSQTSSKPMFTGSRASHSSGGGAFDAGWLLVLLPLVFAATGLRRRN